MSKPLKLSTIQKALADDRFDVALAGAKACKKTPIPENVLRQWSLMGNPAYLIATIYAYGGEAPKSLTSASNKHFMFSNDKAYREAVVWAISQGSEYSNKILSQLSPSEVEQISGSVAYNLPFYKIPFWLRSKKWQKRCIALKATEYYDEFIPLKWLFSAVFDRRNNGMVEEAAVNAIRHRHERLPKEVLERHLAKAMRVGHLSFNDYAKIVKIIAGRKDMRDLFDDIRQKFTRCDASLGGLIPKTFRYMHLSVNEIEELFNSSVYSDRESAIYASTDRFDIPNEWVTHATEDSVHSVRKLAIVEAVRRYNPQPRDFDLPKRVSQICLNGVRVIASIPDDAYVVRTGDGRFRTNTVMVIDVVGDFFGEDVGISPDDCETQYRPGEIVTKPNALDLNNCDEGMFFNLLEGA